MRRCIVSIVAVVLLAGVAPSSSTCLECHGKTTPGMERQHPYAVDYEVSRAKGRLPLRSPSDASGFGGTVAADLLVGGKVECASCHIPHEEEATTLHRLRVLKTDTSETKLCLACHDVSGE
jgi:nitrate/TMAO reductase-like tetraheme cytochrome c subunit